MEVEHVSFRHAVEILQRLEDGSSTEAAPSKEPLKRRGTALEHTEDEHKLLQQVVGLYHENLKNKPEALKVPRKARPVPCGAHRAFQGRLRGPEPGVSASQGRSQPASTEPQEARDPEAETGHQHFSGCVLTPIFDEQGAVMGLYRTAHHGGATRSARAPVPSRPAPRRVESRGARRLTRGIILCESLIDAMTFWCAGCAT